MPHCEKWPAPVLACCPRRCGLADALAVTDAGNVQVVELKEELQKRKLPYAGKKDELVTRLAGAMELEASQTQLKRTVEMCVGKDVSPYVGMRVRHVQGKDHRSSRGLLGTIEIIPGRGALKADERSVSVRWDADTSDVRGPYYTGEPCDRGSGIGTEKFDLITLQEVDEEDSEQPVSEQEEATPAPEDGKKDAMEERCVPAGESIKVEGLQDEEDSPVHGDAQTAQDEDPVAAAAAAQEPSELVMDVEQETQQRLPSPVTLNEQATRKSGSKRTSDGEIKDAPTDAAAAPSPAATASVQALQQRLNQCKQAWTQRMSTDPQSPSPARPKVLRTPVNAKASADESQPEEVSRPVTRNSSNKKPAAAALATPAKEASAAEKASSSKKARGMPSAVEPSNTLCSSAKKAAQPVGPCTQPHESVQHFRAIISRIHAEKQASDFSSSASAALPPRASTSRMPSALVSSSAAASTKEEAAAAHASKPVTWPPPPLKATGIKLAEGSETRSSRLTEDRLSAHIKSEGKHSMLQAFTSSPAVTASGSGNSRGVAREASTESMNDGGKRVMDAAARQQRAAENRARMEAEMKQKAADQERRRRELESKRLEAEKIAKERRDREAQEQQQRLDAAKRRAQEDEERRLRAIQEQEERKRQERERAEQQERERQLEKERQAKEQERIAAAEAAAAAAKKAAVPAFSGASGKTPGGLFGAIGSVFKGVLGTPGTGDAAPPPPVPSAPSTSAVSSLKQKEPADQGPTSIKIIESKNSDDSDSDDDDKKQPVPLWAQSPNLRRQLNRQVGLCPPPPSAPPPPPPTGQRMPQRARASACMHVRTREGWSGLSKYQKAGASYQSTTIACRVRGRWCIRACGSDGRHHVSSSHLVSSCRARRREPNAGIRRVQEDVRPGCHVRQPPAQAPSLRQANFQRQLGRRRVSFFASSFSASSASSLSCPWARPRGNVSDR